MKFALILAAMLAFGAPAVAQHKHGDKGPNGGPMEDVAGVHAELMISGATITVNIFDEDSKPLPTAGYTASALVISGQDRETLKLTPEGNSLKGDAKKAVARNTSITVMVKTAAGKSGQARFKH